MLQKKKQIHRHKVEKIRKVAATEDSAPPKGPPEVADDTNVRKSTERRPSGVKTFLKAALEKVKSGKHIRFFVDEVFKVKDVPKETESHISVPAVPAKQGPSSFKTYYPGSMPANILSLLIRCYTATVPSTHTELPRWIAWPRWICSAKLGGRIIGPIGSG